MATKGKAKPGAQAPAAATGAARTAAYRESGVAVSVILRGPSAAKWEALRASRGMTPTELIADLIKRARL